MTDKMYIFLSEFDCDTKKRSNILQYAYMLGFVELNPIKAPRYRVSALGKQAMENWT
jgi:hypothetical protein